MADIISKTTKHECNVCGEDFATQEIMSGHNCDLWGPDKWNGLRTNKLLKEIGGVFSVNADGTTEFTKIPPIEKRKRGRKSTKPVLPEKEKRRPGRPKLEKNKTDINAENSNLKVPKLPNVVPKRRTRLGSSWNRESSESGILRQCTFCTETYDRSSNLRNHILNHFKSKLMSRLPTSKPFNCPNCDVKDQRDKITLMRHFAFAHKVILEYCKEEDLLGKVLAIDEAMNVKYQQTKSKLASVFPSVLPAKRGRGRPRKLTLSDFVVECRDTECGGKCNADFKAWGDNMKVFLERKDNKVKCETTFGSINNNQMKSVDLFSSKIKSAENSPQKGKIDDDTVEKEMEAILSQDMEKVQKEVEAILNNKTTGMDDNIEEDMEREVEDLLRRITEEQKSNKLKEDTNTETEVIIDDEISIIENDDEDSIELKDVTDLENESPTIEMEVEETMQNLADTIEILQNDDGLDEIGLPTIDVQEDEVCSIEKVIDEDFDIDNIEFDNDELCNIPDDILDDCTDEELEKDDIFSDENGDGIEMSQTPTKSVPESIERSIPEDRTQTFIFSNESKDENCDYSQNLDTLKQISDTSSTKMIIPSTPIKTQNESNIIHSQETCVPSPTSNDNHSPSYSSYLAQMRAKYFKTFLNVESDDEDEGPKEDCDMGGMDSTLLKSANSFISVETMHGEDIPNEQRKNKSYTSLITSNIQQFHDMNVCNEDSDEPEYSLGCVEILTTENDPMDDIDPKLSFKSLNELSDEKYCSLDKTTIIDYTLRSLIDNIILSNETKILIDSIVLSIVK